MDSKLVFKKLRAFAFTAVARNGNRVIESPTPLSKNHLKMQKSKSKQHLRLFPHTGI